MQISYAIGGHYHNALHLVRYSHSNGQIFLEGREYCPKPLGVDCEGTAAGDLNAGRKRGTARAPSFVPVEKLATI